MIHDSERRTWRSALRCRRKGTAVRYEYHARISRVEDAFPKNEFDLSKEATVELTGIDRDALLKVADMLECNGECSGCECGKGTFCEAPTIAATRIREALGVES